MELSKKQIGLRIKDIRLNSPKLVKHSRDELAEVVGSSRSNVSRWERGINIPNPKTLKTIADLGNKTVDELLYGSLEEFAYSVLIDDINNHGEFYESFIEQYSKSRKISPEDVTPYDAFEYIENNKAELLKRGIDAHLLSRANTNLNSSNKIKLYDSKRMISSLIYALTKIMDLPLDFDEYYNEYLNASKSPYYYTSKNIDEIKNKLMKDGKSEEAATKEAYERFYISKLSKHLIDFKKGIKDVKKEYDDNKKPF